MRSYASIFSDSSQLGPVFGPLIAAAPLNELGAGRPDKVAAQKICGLSLADAFAPHKIVDSEMAEACLAGLWLMYDDLDRSHTISQSIETPTGSFWHGIMHRREGDFGNSKYWFHRVGAHPIFPSLLESVRELAPQNGDDRDVARLAEAATWDPFRFVDLCSAAVKGRSTAGRHCQLIQQRECRLLFDFCYRHAIEVS